MVFLSIIFVTHGDRINVVDRLASSLEAYKNDPWVEIICVDNGSNPPAYELLKKSYPFIRVFRNDENLGTSRAYNRGIKGSKGKYLLIINDDSVIPEGMLYNIKSYLIKNSNIDGLALGLKNENNSYQYLRLKIINFKFSNPIRKTRATFAGTGNLLVKKNVIENVGLFDENYFAGNEDMDLSYRMKKNNVKIYYIPDFYIYHLHVYAKKKSTWKEFIVARRLSDIYFAKKFFPFFTPFVRIYAYRFLLKKIGKETEPQLLKKIKKLFKIKLPSYYNLQKDILKHGIEKSYNLYSKKR